ncbi:hypothetical protein L3X38_022878 [Prunus dulcis]|uniref:Uncharacterized protein n=1 Tax=Prunus dulcis TaxID=3755 RepID=A0AAD4VYG8_PRUDU|nr:hypothetical protein L3X38_022878 [Prunus dulcis]
MRCRESMLSFKEFQCQVLAEEIMLANEQKEIMLVHSSHACYTGSPYHSPGRTTSYYPWESRSCNDTVPQSIGHQEILFTTSASTVSPLPIKTVFSIDAFAEEEATMSPIGSPISKLQLSDEIIAYADVVLPQIPTSSIAMTLHDGKASGSHDEGETGKTVISRNDKFAGDIPLVTPKLHFDRISHFDLNVVLDIQICVLASDIDYNATVLLVVLLTIVSCILALAAALFQSYAWLLQACD